jgi:hypothetical protein
LKRRYGIVAGALAAVAVLLIPAVASAASYSGNWSASEGSSYVSASYSTSKSGKACVDLMSLTGVGYMQFSLAFTSGGHTDVPYTSGEETKTGDYCSPTKSFSDGGPTKVYVDIYVSPAAFGSGTYTITTN